METVGRRGILLLVSLLSFCGPASHASFLETTNNKALFQLQPYKEETTANYEQKPFASASLVNLNSNINAWYLLRLVDNRKVETIYNIIPVSEGLRIGLDPASPELSISGDGDPYRCDIATEIAEPFKQRARSRSSYFPACNNLLLIVVKQDGSQTTVEKGAEVIRWLMGDEGEEIINDVKEGFFKDKYLVEGQTDDSQEAPAATDKDEVLPKAAIQPRYKNTSLPDHLLGLKTAEKRLFAGRWYPLQNYEGFYASMIEPGMVAQEILGSHLDRVNRLDGVENTAVAYLMAFSLNRYSMGWGHGTDLPGVGWSARAVHIKKDNPYGPDGFNSMRPLIPLGHIPPSLWPRVVGTFSGGFQLRHSAFRNGEFAKTNKGHHYGFMENGVLMVTPVEGLATLITYKDGSVDLKTWTGQDQERLPLMKHIRQNGVPLIERNEAGQGIPGQYVKHWTAGNWSGSADKELRTPRGAACLIETPQDKFLVYAYFSGATPSGIARVFQAYGCNYAFHLDMNSPGQAYASLSRPKGNGSAFEIEHLMTGMFMGDTKGTPRYLLKPDYKDFFYILRKE